MARASDPRRSVDAERNRPAGHHLAAAEPAKQERNTVREELRRVCLAAEWRTDPTRMRAEAGRLCRGQAGGDEGPCWGAGQRGGARHRNDRWVTRAWPLNSQGKVVGRGLKIANSVTWWFHSGGSG